MFREKNSRVGLFSLSLNLCICFASALELPEPKIVVIGQTGAGWLNGENKIKQAKKRLH